MKAGRKTFLIIIVFILLQSFSIAVSLEAEQKDVVRVAFNPSLPPYQYQEGMQFKGLNFDILNLIALHNNLKIQYYPMSREDCLQALDKRQVDMIMGLRFNYDLEQTGKVKYSDSLEQSTVCFITRKDRAAEIQKGLNQENYLVAVQKGTEEFNFLSSIKKINYNLANDQEAVIQLLLLDRADFALGVRHVAEYLLMKEGLEGNFSVINSYAANVEYYFGILPERDDLLKIINGELRDMKLGGQYEKLYDKWVRDSENEARRSLRRFLQFSAVAIIVVMTIITIGLIWNLQLKKQVDRKTMELTAANSDLQAQIMETKNSNELKNFMCESSPRGIVIFNREGIITDSNKIAMDMAGCDIALTGRSAYDTEPFNLMIADHVSKVLEDGDSVMGKELRYSQHDVDIEYRYTIYPLFNYEKNLIGAIITVEDVTQEKKMQERVAEREKYRSLSQIISGIAHEIRNPLTSIKTYAELLPRKSGNDRFRNEVAEVVPQEVERVNDLIENLIDYARPRTKNIEDICMNELTESCILLFRPVMNKKNIEIKADIDENISIKADRNQMKQVLINFILNAADAIEEKREKCKSEDRCTIYITAQEINGCVTLKVTDNGIGMTKEEIKRAYELFYTTKEKGTGLGLPLSKQLVEENNGQMRIDSVKNVATTITLTFVSQDDIGEE